MGYYSDNWEELDFKEENYSNFVTVFLFLVFAVSFMILGAFLCSIYYDPEITWFPALIDFIGDLL